jgi:hypothetical protein
MPRPTQCIAKGCRHANKGPRFHFLCVDHRGASMKTIAIWQAEFHAKAKQVAKRAAKTAKKPKR